MPGFTDQSNLNKGLPMKIISALAVAFALSVSPALAFEWNPKAFNYEDCLTRQSAAYCDAASGSESLGDTSSYERRAP